MSSSGEQQEHEHDDQIKGETTIRTSTRKQRVRNGLHKLGNTLQKFNLGKLIDEMEKDQEVADKLEFINKETQEESERKELVREAVARCQTEIQEHLETFLCRQPNGSYEEWILDLHPENVQDGSLISEIKQVDFRFFVRDSDHRKLWNERVPERYVPARTYQGEDLVTVHLHDDDSPQVEPDTVRVIRRET